MYLCLDFVVSNISLFYFLSSEFPPCCTGQASPGIIEKTFGSSGNIYTAVAVVSGVKFPC